MTRDEHSELLQIASSIIAQHIPAMGYRVPQGEETMQLSGVLKDGLDSIAVDMLTPELRTQFSDMLGDACHLISMAFRRAVDERIDDEDEDDMEEQEEPGDKNEDNQPGEE